MDLDRYRRARQIPDQELGALSEFAITRLLYYRIEAQKEAVILQISLNNLKLFGEPVRKSYSFLKTCSFTGQLSEIHTAFRRTCTEIIQLFENL